MWVCLSRCLCEFRDWVCGCLWVCTHMCVWVCKHARIQPNNFNNPLFCTGSFSDRILLLFCISIPIVFDTLKLRARLKLSVQRIAVAAWVLVAVTQPTTAFQNLNLQVICHPSIIVSPLKSYMHHVQRTQSTQQHKSHA